MYHFLGKHIGVSCVSIWQESHLKWIFEMNWVWQVAIMIERRGSTWLLSYFSIWILNWSIASIERHWCIGKKPRRAYQIQLLLSSESTNNHTVVTITRHLVWIISKFNQELKTIVSKQGWFKFVNINKVNIHLWTSYQIATNCIIKPMNKQINRGTLYNIIINII